MSEPIEIQCPTCAKKYKLKGTPPAVFTCTNAACGTPMDLSAFRTAAAPAPSRATAATGVEGRGGARLSGRAARARLRRSRGDGGEDETGAPRGLPPKKDGNGLIIGSMIGLVVVGGIALVAMSKKKTQEETAPTTPTRPATADAGASASTPVGPAAAGTPAAAPAAGAPAAPGTAPAAGPSPAGATPAAPPEKPVPKGQLHEVGHHPDATDAEKAQIDQLIQKAVFENAGADSREAGSQLVALGYKAVPRLINVFHTVSAGEGFGSIDGRMKAGVADGLLRRIDGFQERTRRLKQPIKATSDEKYAAGVAKGWFLFWDAGIWKEKPSKPWDERIDGAEEEARKNAGE